MSLKIKVLICEDHTIYRTGIKAALQSKDDIEIIGEAADGQELLNKLTYLNPDVILLDINMPRMDGVTAIQKIKENDRYKNIKVIVLTMQNDSSMVTNMMFYGANSYLTKNADSEVIYKAIVTCYNDEYYFNKLTNESLIKTIKKNPFIIYEDDDFKKVESERKEKLKKLNAEQVKQEPKIESKDEFNFRVPRYIIKGIATGLITSLIIIFLFYIVKALSNNMNFNNFTP